jgi:hypothetical protein
MVSDLEVSIVYLSMASTKVHLKQECTCFPFLTKLNQVTAEYQGYHFVLDLLQYNYILLLTTCETALNSRKPKCNSATDYLTPYRTET